MRTNTALPIDPAILKEGSVEGSVPCPGQPELAYKGEKFSARDRLRPC